MITIFKKLELNHDGNFVTNKNDFTIIINPILTKLAETNLEKI